MIQTITSRNNDRIKDIAKLKEVAYRNEKEMFLIEGFHLLEMALSQNLVVTVLSTKEIAKMPEHIEQIIVTDEIIEKLSGQKNPQGVVAVCHYLKSKQTLGNRILFLDDVADPGNVGTLIRTALSFDFTSVVMTDKCASAYNEKVISASQGAIFAINIVKTDVTILAFLREKHYQIIATSLQATKTIEQLVPKAPLAVILGNEAHGISAAALAYSNENILIPISHIDSLNVAIAGGIVMYYVSR